MKRLSHIVAVIIWVACCLMLAKESSPVYGFLFFVPFSLFPHAITHVMVAKANDRISLSLLLVALVGYFGWFLFVYVQAFHTHLDAQSSIALLFVGTYSMPAMIPLWVASAIASRLHKPAQQADSEGTPLRGAPDL